MFWLMVAGLGALGVFFVIYFYWGSALCYFSIFVLPKALGFVFLDAGLAFVSMGLLNVGLPMTFVVGSWLLAVGAWQPLGMAIGLTLNAAYGRTVVRLPGPM